MTYYIAHNGVCIDGLGWDSASALDDAAVNVNAGDIEPEWETEECTEALYRLVQEVGGAVSWTYLPGGLACTDDERADHDWRAKLYRGFTD